MGRGGERARSLGPAGRNANGPEEIETAAHDLSARQGWLTWTEALAHCRDIATIMARPPRRRPRDRQGRRRKARAIARAPAALRMRAEDEIGRRSKWREPLMSGASASWAPPGHRRAFVADGISGLPMHHDSPERVALGDGRIGQRASVLPSAPSAARHPSRSTRRWARCGNGRAHDVLRATSDFRTSAGISEIAHAHRPQFCRQRVEGCVPCDRA